MPAPLAAIGPALKMLASQGLKKAATETAKNVVKDKAKNFVTGKGRKKKGKRGKGGALVKSEGGQEEESQEGGGAIVATTPIVGKYRVEEPPQKPDEVGKPSKVSYEAINNQLDSIVGLTEALKKTSMAKMKTATNRRKAERKAEEKAKQRNRENLLEKGAVGAIGAVGGAISKAAPFDPIKFFTMIFLGSLLLWIVNNGSKITAFLKMTLALMNNFGKLVKAGFTALKNVFKIGFNAIKKLGGPLVKVGKALKNGIKSVGNGLARAFGRIGNGIKNLAKGVINKIKAAGKILTSPLKALQGLTGAEKKAVKANSGLNKLLQQGGTGSQNLGTATRPPGTLSNATRSMRMRHGDEAARMYQGLIDNGMKPSKAAQYVNKSIKSGKLTSAPLQGSLAGGKKGSQLFKGGVGRSTNRMIAKFGGKNALKVTKALKGALGRIPIIGPIITGIVSILSGDPPDQTLFKVGGAAIGGVLGTFIPIPVVGTLFGEIVGEYVGDLIYHLINGGKGDTPTAGEKLKNDLTDALSVGQKAMDWVGNGFGRMYEGFPKYEVPGWVPLVGGKKFPKPEWLLSFTNIPEKLGIFHKAFFTDKPMEKGEEEKGASRPSVPLTGQAAQIQNQQYYHQPGVGYFRVGGGGEKLGDTEEEARTKLGLATTSNQSGGVGFAAPLFDLIAKGEGGYNSINRGNAGDSPGGAKKYFGKDLTSMTVGEISDLQAQKRVYAVGKYQIVPTTMLDFIARGGVSRDDMFDAATQEKFPKYVIYTKRPVVGKYLEGKASLEDAIINLSAEFASIGVPRDMKAGEFGNGYPKSDRPKGTTFYGGTSNFAHTTPEKVAAALQQIKGGGSQPPAQQPQTSNLQGQGQQGAQSSVQPQTPMVPGNVTPSQSQQPSVGPQLGGLSGHSGSVSYNGQQQASLSVAYSPFAQSDITSQGMQIISGKGYRASTDSIHKGFDVPAVKGTPVYAYLPGKITQNRPAAGYGNIVEWQDSIYGEKHMFAHLMEPGPLPVGTEFQAGTLLAKTGDTGTPGSYHLHWEIGSQGSEKDPAAWVAAHPIKDVPQAQVQQQSQQPRGIVTPSTGSVTTGSQSSSSTTPAQVSPSPQVQTQRSNEITGVSQQLPYEQVGGTTILMAPGSSRGGGTMVGKTSAGTPVIVGSGDVVNSYYKSQLLGFLYKQG